MSASLLDLKNVTADEAARIFALADRLSGENRRIEPLFNNVVD